MPSVMASCGRTFTSSSNRFRWVCGLWLFLTLCAHVGFATSTLLTFYVDENVPKGTIVGTVPINGGTSLPIGPIPNSIDQNVKVTGVIKTTRPLDRENQNEAKISFKIGVLAAPIRIYIIEIIVNDLNDNSPKFNKNVYFLKFYEGSPGYYQYQDVEALDKDNGVNSTQKYSIVSGNIGHVFKLNSSVRNDGNVYGKLLLNGSLDREKLDRYLLNISAQDGGTPPRVGYTLLNITVGDINDNAPVFTSRNYSSNILENATIGTSIATISATDADIGLNAEIEYAIDRGSYSDPKLIFNVDSKTGLVTNNLKLDYEKQQEYRIVVIARNSGASGVIQTGTASLTIKVLDLNDNQPVIKVNYVLGGSYQVLEGTPNGKTVARIAVSDADSGSNGEAEVSLQATEGYFRIEPIPGDGYAVKVAKLIDRETKRFFIPKVVATDKGNPAKTTEEFFRINVGDINDNSPKFDSSVYYGSVSEDAVKGKLVLSVHATDKDIGSNAELTYNIVSFVQDAAYKDWFTIVPATGEIKTAGVLDRENVSQPVLSVTVTDKGSPPRTDNCTVIVEICDANDNDPYFNQSLYFASVVENSPNGSRIVQVFADDSDIGINSVITYSIASTGNKAVPFVITNNSGVVSTTGPIDHEHRTLYTLIVVATDGGGRNTTTKVNVTVIDENDNSPLFSPEFYNMSYLEDVKVGSVLVNLSASDKDSGKFAKLHYDIKTGNSRGLFLVDHTTGAIKLAKSLDRETKDFHSLTITVEDGGGRISTNFATVNLKVLDVNDEPPVFTKQHYNYSIAENSKVPSVLGNVLATSKDIGSNADISYTIEGGNTGDIFVINGSGIIYMQAPIDHETTPTVLLNVVAKDGGKPPLYGYANVTVSVIDLNDNSPTFNNSQISVYIPENTKIGETFYTLFAFDPDSREYGQVTYKLLENPNSTFQLDPVTGKLSLTKTVSYKAEGITQYSTRVLAQDGGLPPRNATVTLKLQVVDVNDHSPVFGNSSYSVHVNEATDANRDIIQVSATDKDTGSNAVITYSLQSQPNSVSLHFGIKADGTVFLRTKLDRERKAVHYLIVIAADRGVPIRTTHADLTVYVADDNDNSPKFNRSQGYTFSIIENQDSGTSVGRLYASDLDTGSNAQLRYKFDSSVPQFLLNSVTGEIRTAEKLDREKKSSYDLMAIVSDSSNNPREDKVRVIVLVRDQNDNNPKFDRDANYKTSILENVRVGTSVLTVSASDPDDGLNGQVTYSIITGAANRFKIDSRSGIIKTIAALDREKKDLYVLSIEARDSGSPDQSSSKMVFVNILDVNDNHPQFPNNTKTVYLKERVPAGSYVTTVTAKDPDKNLNGQVWYKIIQGNTGDTFVINKTSGAIHTTKALDHERTNRYELQIQATDKAQMNPQHSIMYVIVHIIDSNDNRPTFKENPMFRYVREGVPINTTFITIKAQDADSKGPNSDIWYQIDSQSPGHPHFRIDQKTGAISTIAEIDRESIDEFTLIIRATDQAFTEQERLSSTATLVVLITDINDNKPRFTSRSFTFVMEDEPVQYPVMSITAVDDDEGSNGDIEYGMANQQDKLHFHLDKYGGLLKLIGQLDYEKQPEYILNITAKDSGSPALMSYQIFKVIVVDVNDNPPKFNNTIYIGSVGENEQPGSFVIRVEATDKDSGTNANLSYSIPQGLDKHKFSIDKISGIITTNVTFDHEVKKMYEMTVYVRDSAFPFRVDTSTVRIQVVDKNDNPPRFTPAVLVLRVAENQPASSFHTMIVKDIDSGVNAQNEFSIIRGNSEGCFGIGKYSGVLSTKVSLDRENKSYYELVIQAKNIIYPHFTTTANVTVLVEDENDNKPKFSAVSYTISVNELILPGTNILNVSALDSDAGSNGRITYSLSGKAVGIFQIDAKTGQIFTMQPFDFKRKNQYEFICIATDQGVTPKKDFSQVSVKIEDQNDHSPVFEQFPYQNSVASGAASGQFVLKVSATDGDAGTNADISYSLSASSNAFVLESNSGNIKTKEQLGDGRYILRIQATDKGVPPLTGSGIVEIVVGTVSDTPPRFVNASPSAVAIAENSPKDSEVARVSATGASVSYSIVDGNHGSTFSVDPQTGVVTVTDVSKLDYEFTHKFELHIVATSTSKSLNAYLKLIISLLDVNDNRPTFHPTNLNIQLVEDDQMASHSFRSRLVADVNGTDADSGSNAKIEYSIVSGNTGDRFEIDSSSGEIKTRALLDREQQSVYNLIVRASNPGSPDMSQRSLVRVIITDVNDNQPQFVDHAPVQVPESTNVGTVITRLNVTDDDQTPRLAYTFRTGAQQEGPFRVGKFSGAIFLLKSLDYETRKLYSLHIVANDSLYTTGITFNISVLDVNDQSPEFEEKSYHATIREDVQAGASILKVRATDKDSGTNGQVKYSIQISFVSMNYFMIDERTGVISTSKPISVSNDAQIQLLVSAADGGHPPNSAVVPVLIIIRKSIQFSQDRYQSSVLENAVMGTSVVSVSATSASGRSLDRISYRIRSGSSVPFRIGRRSGLIKVSGKLDFEKKRNYTLFVEATDTESATTRVDIYVQDINDNAPEFRKSHYMKTVFENIRVGTTLFRFNATDKDSGRNGKIRFYIQSGDVKKSFHLNNKTGVLITAKSLDHDTLKRHKLAVEARDEGNPSKVKIVSAIIDVTDLNDNWPVFNIPERLTVAENSDIGTSVGRITASDRDSGTNGKVTYSIIGGSGRGLFRIDGHTGNLETNRTFDYEEQRSYSLTIKAIDGGVNPLSNNATVVVYIGSMDEYKPRFVKHDYRFEVNGDAEVGDVVGRVFASDDDGGPDGRVYYTIDEPTTDVFAVNRTSGVIYVNQTLDKAKELRSRRSTERDTGTGTRQRERRNTDSTVSNVQLRVLANSGKDDSNEDVSYVKIAINFPAAVAKEPQQFSNEAKSLIVGLACLAGLLIVVIVVLAIIFKRKKRKRNRRDPPLRFDGSFDEITVLPPPPPNGTANYAHVGWSEEDLPRPRAVPDELTPLNRQRDNSSSPSNTSANSSVTPRSASSGRGSEGDGDFGESQTVLVRERASVHSEKLNGKASTVPDSGIQQDDDQISQLTVSDGSGIFSAHVDGFASESKSDKTDKTDRIFRGLESQESLHVFGDEGGGEADGGMDVGNLLYAKLAEVDADEDESITDGTQQYIDEGINHPSYGGSLSSIVGSQEELTGSYNWDYLLNWGPQFQPLADVFLEIGRMKDEVHFHPKLVPESLPSSHATHAQPAGIRTTDMLSSVSSLPRTPISHPSTSYSSPALSPNFTPAITPLVTRSPSISPLDTPSPLLSPQSATPASHSRPSSTHIVHLRRDSHGSNSDLTHSPSISDNESNLEIDV